MKLLTPWKESYDQPKQHIEKRFVNKGPPSQGYGFSSGHVRMWELDSKESWAPKNWCFWTVVLEKTLENPLDCKEIQSVHSKGDQSWVFIGRTDVEAETLILWPLDAKSWLIGKDPDAGKDLGQEEKGMTEGEMVGWHHRLNGHGSWWWTGKPGVLQFMGSQKAGHNWATELSEADEPRACFTEWTKSKRERQISCINIYIWNREKWYWCIYLQGSNTDTDRADLCTQLGKERVGRTERAPMKHVHCVRAVASASAALWTTACQAPVPGIFQARILEWVAISYSRGSSQPRDWTPISCITSTGRRILYHANVKQIASRNLLYNTSSTWCSVTT